LVRESIFLDRIGEGDSARLKFETTNAFYCSLEIYSQDADIVPKKANPRKVECDARDAATKEFVETIDELRTDTLYYVVIHLKKKADDEKPAESITIRESGNASDSKDEDGNYTQIYQARLNQPLKTAQFHKHVFAKPSSISEIKTQLTRKIGCGANIPTAAGVMSKPDSSIEFTALTTTNFGAGKATAHEEINGVLEIEYNALNKGIDRWSFLYSKDGNDFEMRALPGNIIENFEMISDDTYTFVDPKLEDNEYENPLDALKSNDLKFAWETDRKLSSTIPSYVVIKIGQANNGESIQCVFEAKTSKGTIPSSLMSQLSNGTYDVLVELETSQVWAKDGWLVVAYDWRQSKLSVQ